MVVALAYGAYVEFSPSKIRQRDPAAEAAATRAEDARRPKHPDVLLQVAVSKVSIDAGLALISPYLSYAMDDPAPCLMAKHIDRGVALGGDPIVIKMAADFHAECQFVELTRALMHPVFETIAASGALPTDLYAFQVFHGQEWSLVGLFDGGRPCMTALAEASARGYGTKACGPWHPRF